MPAGAIYARESEISIDGNASFNKNSAVVSGGDNNISVCIACNALNTATTYSGTTLQESPAPTMFYVLKSKHNVDWPFFPIP